MINKLFLGLLLTLTCSGSLLAVSDLLPEQSQKVLQELDSVCGDSWCAGDLNYSFDAFSCTGEQCSLNLSFWPRNTNAEGKNLLSKRRTHRCDLQALTPAQFSSLSPTLYDAVNACIQDEIQKANPLIYLPSSVACLESLKQKPYFKSAAHSIYAEVFYEMSDPALASAEVLTQLVDAYSQKDESCSNQIFTAFKDEVDCQGPGGLNKVCSLPTDQGQFLVIKDGVDGAAVLFIDKAKKHGRLGVPGVSEKEVTLLQPEFCYEDLLNFNGLDAAQSPFNSSDHHSFFVSTLGLAKGQDSRVNAALLIGKTIDALSQKAPDRCKSESMSQSVPADACKIMGNVEVCAIFGKNAGYYLVTKDTADGAFVTFVRYD